MNILEVTVITFNKRKLFCIGSTPIFIILIAGNFFENLSSFQLLNNFLFNLESASYTINKKVLQLFKVYSDFQNVHMILIFLQNPK